MTQLYRYTINRALTRIKILQSKLEEHARTSLFFIAAKVSDFDAVNKHNVTLSSNMQSVKDLTTELLKLKQAVQQANSNYTVTVLGKQYTITEAIELRRVYKTVYNQLLESMARQLNSAKAMKRSADEKIEEATVVLLKDNQPSDEVLQVLQHSHGLSILSFNNSESTSAEQDYLQFKSEVENYLQEIDIALSEANANNFIYLNIPGGELVEEEPSPTVNE